MEECVLAFKFMSDLFQKSTVFTIMLFSLATLTHIALSLSLLFLHWWYILNASTSSYGISYRLGYVMNDPKAERIKQRTFISSQLLWVRSSLAGRFHPGSLASAGRQLSMELTGCEGSMFSWLTPVTLPEDSLPHQLLAGGLGLLPHGPLSSASWVALCHDSWLSLGVWSNREQDRSQNAFSDLALEVTLIIPAPSCWLQRSAPSSMGGNHMRVWALEGKNLWRLAPTQHH